MAGFWDGTISLEKRAILSNVNPPDLMVRGIGAPALAFSSLVLLSRCPKHPYPAADFLKGRTRLCVQVQK